MKTKIACIISLISLFVSASGFSAQSQTHTTAAQQSAQQSAQQAAKQAAQQAIQQAALESIPAANPAQPSNTPAPATAQTAAAIQPAAAQKVTNFKTNYFSIGAKLYGMNQDVEDSANTESDVRFFAANMVIEFQYLFRRMMLKVNFEYSKYNVKMYLEDNLNNNYSYYKKYRKKIVNATLGYTSEFSNKYLLVFPSIGFGYQDYDNPIRSEDFRTEMYYLILNSRFYIKINNIFDIGFDMDFRIILSQIATLDYKTFGNSRVILRKGFYFSFRAPMKVNLGSYFFFSAIPYVEIVLIPQSDGILVDLDTGAQNSESFYKYKMISGGIKLMFGVYF